MNQVVKEKAETALDPSFRHPLLAEMIQIHGSGSVMKRFGKGATLVFRSAKLLAKTRELWKLAIIPAAINIALFVLTTTFLLWNYEWFIPGEPTGDGIWATILFGLWWILKVLIFPLLLLMSYFISIVFAQVLASPFNDALSEKAETVLHGEPVAGPTGLREMVKGGLKGGFQAFVLALGKLMVALPLGFIPGIGPIISAVFTSYFFAVDNTDYAFERRRYGLRAKLKTLFADKAMTLGFGAGVWAIFAIPFLNFFCMPIAVMGGTALALTYHEEDEPLPGAPSD